MHNLTRFCSNNSVRQHVNTSRHIFPHRRITRKSEMTSKGLVVVEQEEEITNASTSDLSQVASSGHERTDSRGSNGVNEKDPREVKRSAIGELLYVRWLEGLRLKWPSIL